MLGHALSKFSKTETKAKNKKDNHVTSTRRMMTHHRCYWSEDREPIYPWSDCWVPEPISREDITLSVCQYLKAIEHAW